MSRHKRSLFVCNMLIIALLTMNPMFDARVARASYEGWEIVSTPNASSSNNYLLGVSAVAEDDVWAVGWFISGGSPSDQTLIQHWKDNTWSIVTSPNPGTSQNRLFSVAAIASNNVWAVGEKNDGFDPYRTLIVHWNGTSWTDVASPNQGSGQNSLHGISAVAEDDIWAVGSYIADGLYHTLIEHWNGRSWSITPSPNPGTAFNAHRGVAGISSDDAWAVGQYASNEGGRSLTQHWKNSTWNAISTPNQGGASNLTAVAAIATNDVWAVGGYFPDSCWFCIQTLTMHWNGSQWTIVSSPNLGPSYSEFHSVHPLDSDYVWAVGAGSNGGSVRTLTEYWNGTEWNIVQSPNQGPGNNALYGVGATPGTWAETNGTVWAVGYYTNRSSTPMTLAMKYHICKTCDYPKP